jgi:hypothetical protein
MSLLRAHIFWVLAIFCLQCPLYAGVTVISQDTESMVIHFDLEGSEFKETLYENRKYLVLSAPGWEKTMEEGAPQLPVFNIPLYIPDNGSLKTEILEENYREATRLPHDLAFKFERDLHNGRSNPVKRSAAAYLNVYGKDLVKKSEEGFAGSEKLIFLELNPVFYNAVSREVRLLDRARVRIRWNSRSHKSAGLARYIAWNSAALPENIARDSKTDLIIAHVSHEQTLKRYINFKKTVGRKIREYYVDKKSSANIKAIIEKEYAASPPPNNTFLVGNINQIPSWKGSGDNTWSDFKYSTLGTDEIPDLALGRVPAGTAEELLNWVDKSITRELEEKNLDEILLTAGRDTSMGCPANVTKVGEKIKQAGPDIKITKKYRTEVSTEEVIQGYNSNPNIIIYDGHGDRTSMFEIPLSISGLSQLKNNVYPLIFDIACLNANWTNSGPSPRNFAESILLASKSGAAGIMASGGSGYGHEFFRTIGEIMAKSRQNLATDPKMNEVGNIILAAKIRHSKQDRTYWNYYGDPANSVWESTLRPATL